MVFYFTTSDGHTIYMGKDKFENEDLIKYGWPEDVWFHVNSLSSAHVYYRMQKDETWENLNKEAYEQCCQLVKENSIEGCKKSAVDIVYTPCKNLMKKDGMDVGQVGFHKKNQVKYFKNVEKNKDVLKLINKTKVEDYPDLAIELAERNKSEIYEKKQLAQIERAENNLIDKKNAAIRKEWNEAENFFVPDTDAPTNKDVDDEDDFM